jgi:hypothetical protein
MLWTGQRHERGSSQLYVGKYRDQDRSQQAGARDVDGARLDLREEALPCSPISDRRYLIPFRSELLPSIFTDTLVIGTGVAGLRAALAAAEHGEVIVVAKDDLDEDEHRVGAGRQSQRCSPPTIARTSTSPTRCGAAPGSACPRPSGRSSTRGRARVATRSINSGMRLRPRRDGGALAAHPRGRARTPPHRRTPMATRPGASCRARSSRPAARDPRIRLFEQLLRARSCDRGHHAARRATGVLGAITHHPKYGLQTRLGARDHARLGRYGAALARDDELAHRNWRRRRDGLARGRGGRGPRVRAVPPTAL